MYTRRHIECQPVYRLSDKRAETYAGRIRAGAAAGVTSSGAKHCVQTTASTSEQTAQTERQTPYR